MSGCRSNGQPSGGAIKSLKSQGKTTLLIALSTHKLTGLTIERPLKIRYPRVPLGRDASREPENFLLASLMRALSRGRLLTIKNRGVTRVGTSTLSIKSKLPFCMARMTKFSPWLSISTEGTTLGLTQSTQTTLPSTLRYRALRGKCLLLGSSLYIRNCQRRVAKLTDTMDAVPQNMKRQNISRKTHKENLTYILFKNWSAL